jgi:hypothetical protein
VNEDMGQVGSLVCAILHQVYVENRAAYERHAEERGCTLEELAAAAIAGALREWVEERAG